jgi:hypothetical protein
MSNFIPFNVSINPHNQTINSLFAFAYVGSLKTIKPTLEPTQVCALQWAGPQP